MQQHTSSGSVMEDVRTSSYRSGVPSLEHVAVQLGVHAAGVVGDEGELAISGSGSGQGDPVQGVSHEEGLRTRRSSEASKQSATALMSNSGLPPHPRRTFSPL